MQGQNATVKRKNTERVRPNRQTKDTEQEHTQKKTTKDDGITRIEIPLLLREVR